MRYSAIIWILLLSYSCKPQRDEHENLAVEKKTDSSHLVDLSLEDDENFVKRKPGRKNRFNDSLSEIITTITGRFNADEVQDTAYLMRPAAYDITISKTGLIDSVRNTFVYVRFSCELPYLVINNCYDGSISKVNDIDNSSTDEILFEQEWVQSCWSRADLYRFHSGSWKKEYSAPFYRCAENYTNRVERNSDGFITLYTNGEKIDTTYSGTDTIFNITGVVEKQYTFKLKD